MNKNLWTRSLSLVLLVGMGLISPMASASTSVGTMPGHFSANSVGQASYTMPLPAPGGAGGLSPTLALSYGSRTGHGLMGQDVTVSGISKIARCPASYAYGQAPFSVTLTSADLFCLDGQELTGTDWPYGTNGATYVTTPTGHMEEISYTSNSAEGPQWFKVLHPDGSVWEYGHTTDSEVMATNSSGQSVVRVWLLDKIEDASGNTITFHYTQPSGTGAYYLSSVDWGSNATKGTGADRSYVFTYQTMSSAATKHRYVAGHLIEWNREISKVEYQYNGTTELSWTPTYQTSIQYRA